MFQKRTFRPKKSPTCSNVEIFEHDPQQYDFQNYNSYVCFKNELLHPQKEKSRTVETREKSQGGGTFICDFEWG